MSDYLPVDLRRRVRERFGGCCAYCRSAEDLTVVTFEIEHIVPRAQGGESVFENRVSLVQRAIAINQTAS